MRASQIISSAVACSSLVSAWSWRDNKVGAAIGDVLLPHKRAPQAVTLGNTNAESANPTQTFATATQDSATTTTDDSSQTTNTNSASASASGSGSTASTAKNTGSSSGTASKTGTSSGTKSSKAASTTVIDPRLPAGGVSMITPNTRSSTEYYKIGNFVTFAWNYTSLSVTPTAIDILATCSKNQATYTLAVNQSISASTGAVTWDTGAYQSTATIPLLTETYTLLIYDANKSVSSTPSPGYLGTYNQFTFGMYSPQPYVPLDQYVCVTCSGALSALERQSLTVVGLGVTAALVGATWFTGGFGAML